MIAVSDRLPFGKFGKTHGVKGELRFWPFNPDTELLKKGLKVWVMANPKLGIPEELTISSVRGTDKSIIIRVKELPYRDQIVNLTNMECSVDRDVLPPPSDDEWYQADLIGLSVFSREVTGLEEIGKITSFVDTPGPFDVMVVEGPRLSSRLLVLWKEEIVESVNLQEGLILAPLETWAPEGLELR